MLMNPQSIWWPRLVTFLLAALVAASAAFWVLRWPAPVARAPARTAPASVQTEAQAVARILGAAPLAALAAPKTGGAARYALTGVLADRGGRGVALIAVDGKAPKAFQVGSKLDDQMVLQSVATRQAMLAAAPDAPTAFTLELPRPKK